MQTMGTFNLGQPAARVAPSLPFPATGGSSIATGGGGGKPAAGGSKVELQQADLQVGFYGDNEFHSASQAWNLDVANMSVIVDLLKKVGTVGFDKYFKPGG